MSPLIIPNAGSGASAELLAQGAPDTVDFSILAGALGGVTSGCAVSAQSTPNGTVKSALGVVVVAGVSYSVSAAASLTITSNSSGNPRFDLVIYRVGTGVMVLAGTAAAAPYTAFPTPTFTTDCVLAAVYVANGFSTITNAEIVDKRPAAIQVPDSGYGITGNTGSTPTPAVSLTSTSSFISSNVTLTATTPKDITSLTLAAGTWLLIGQATIDNTTAAVISATGLWISTTSNGGAATSLTGAEGVLGGATAATAHFAPFSCSCIVTPATSTTYYLDAEITAAATTGLVLANDLAQNLSGLIAVRIA